MARIDYVKFGVVMREADRFDIRDRLIAIEKRIGDCAAEAHQDNKGGDWRRHNDHSQKDTHMVVYYELWGELADIYCRRYGMSILQGEIRRIDIRRSLPEQIDLSRMANIADNNGRRQFQQFNQRDRNKSDDRSSGGRGWAKGSHKSERRLTGYKRASETPAMELQLRGKTAQGAFSLARDVSLATDDPTYPVTPANFYANLVDALTDEMDADCVSQLGATFDDTVDACLTDGYTAEEQALRDLERTIRKLGEVQVRALQLFLDLEYGPAV